LEVDDENTPAAAPTGAEADQPADTGPVQAPASAPTAGESTQAQGPDIAPALPKAIVKVLGPPQILNADTARPVRAVAWELLVYLAVHRDGAAPEQIEEDIWPRERRRVSAPRLHTTASNLRHALAAAAGADPGQAEHYLRKHHGRYQLGTVEVDLWQLHDASQEEKEAADARQRLAALRCACDAYHGDLAQDLDYDWVTPHRHHTRELALQAHTTLAGLVAGQHPDEAARLLSQAARVAPLAEPVFQEAMRAHHRIGDPEAIRELLRQLSRNLDQVGAEPSDETLELAASLRSDLQRRDG
jgi:DNA-binding SARP family transcriptional activator